MSTPSPTPFVADVYEGSRLVQDLHKYPHLNDSDVFSLGGDYWVAIETMFYLTCMGGFAFILLQWLFFCFESCCRCCQKYMICSSFVMRMLLTVAFIALLGGTGLTYWGRNIFQEGADKVYMLTSDLKVVFQLLEAQATSIDGRADSCVAYSGLTSVCNGTLAVDSGLVSASDEFKASASATVDLLDGLAPAIGRIGKLFDETIPYIIDWGIGLMTAFMGLTVFFGLWSVTCGSATRQKLVIAFSAVALTLMCPLIAFELTLSVVVSDFCMGLEDGDASLMVMANSYAPKSTRGLVAYYASCNGTNPLAADLASSGESVVLINATAAGLLPGRECSDATLGLVQDESLAAQEEIRAMEGDVGCASVNPYFSQIIYRVICGDVVEGVYWIWVVQLACAVSLWVLLFFVQAEVLARENETKINLALQEQRLGLKPSTFIPKKGTSKRRVYDRKQRKHLLAEDKKVAEQLAATEMERARDEAAWAAADQEAVAEAANDEKRKWLVKNPRGFGTGEERREEALRLGHGGAAAAEAAAKKKADKAAQGKKRRAAKRTFDPDAERLDEAKKWS